MSIALQADWVLSAFYVAMRLAGVFFLVPILGFNALPATVRVVFVLFFAAVIASVPGVREAAAPAGPGALVLAAISEFLIGALIGAALQALVAAFGFGGQLVDFQIGFSAAALFDPATRVQSSLISSILAMLGALAFVVLQFDHVLIRGLVRFFVDVPPGSLVSNYRNNASVDRFGFVFTYGFAIVAPVVLGLMLVDTAIAIASRSMPQVNIYFVALPIKVFAGVFLLGYCIAYVGPLVASLFERGLGVAAQPL